MLPNAVLELARCSVVGLLDNRTIARAGFSSWHITEWVRAGLLERLVPGWYRIAADPVPPTQCLHVALRYLSRRQRNCWVERGDGVPDAAITGAAGAALLGSPAFELPCTPDVLVQHHRAIRLASPPFVVHHTDMRRLAWRVENGVVVADAARVLRDIASDRTVSDVQVRTTVDVLRNRYRLDLVALVDEWSRAPCAGGAQRLLSMARHGAFEQESEGERTAFATLFAAHPPAPDCQVWLAPRLRVDFVYLFAALVVEYYGEAAHANTVDRDARRIWRIRQLHYDVIVVTKSMLHDGEALSRYIHGVRREREREMLAGRLPRPALPAQPSRLTPLRTLVPLG